MELKRAAVGYCLQPPRFSGVTRPGEPRGGPGDVRLLGLDLPARSSVVLGVPSPVLVPRSPPAKQQGWLLLAEPPVPWQAGVSLGDLLEK